MRALAALVVTAAVLTLAPAARADSPDAVGWWTNRSKPSGTPVPTLVPLPIGGSSGSDVPAGGFEVSTQGQTRSYAAFGYSVRGAAPSGLVLHVHPAASNVADSKLQVCPLAGGSVFAPADGGALADGPAYDCTSPVPGVADTSAGTFTFDVTGLAQGGRLAVAVVGLEGSRLAFEKPADDALVVPAPATPEDGGGAAAPVTAPPPPAFTPSFPLIAPAAPPIVAVPLAPPTAAATPPTSVPAAAVTDAPVFAASLPEGGTGPGSAVYGAVVAAAFVAGIARKRRRALAAASAATPA